MQRILKQIPIIQRSDNTKINKPRIVQPIKRVAHPGNYLIKVGNKTLEVPYVKHQISSDNTTKELKLIQKPRQKAFRKEAEQNKQLEEGMNNLSAMFKLTFPSTYLGPALRLYDTTTDNNKSYMDNLLSGEGFGDETTNMMFDMATPIITKGIVGGMPLLGNAAKNQIVGLYLNNAFKHWNGEIPNWFIKNSSNNIPFLFSKRPYVSTYLVDSPQLEYISENVPYYLDRQLRETLYPNFPRTTSAMRDDLFLGGLLMEVPSDLFAGLIGHGFSKASDAKDALNRLLLILERGTAPSKSSSNFGMASWSKDNAGSAIGTASGGPYSDGYLTIYGVPSKSGDLVLPKQNIRGVIINDGYEEPVVRLIAELMNDYLANRYPFLKRNYASDFRRKNLTTQLNTQLNKSPHTADNQVLHTNESELPPLPAEINFIY